MTRPTTGTARPVSRRTIAAGLAWAAPAMAATVAAPAFAASTTTLTGTNDTLQFFTDRYYRSTSIGGTCEAANQGGYLSTQGIATTGSPRSTLGAYSADGRRNPSSSLGLWVETSNSTSGTARINSVTQTFVFSQPIRIVSLASAGARTTGTWRWSKSTELNGWTYTLSADGKTLTLKYQIPTILKTSTATSGTGDYLPGYFLNYEFANTTSTFCPSTNPSAFTVQQSSVTSWSDARGTYSTPKTGSVTPVVNVNP